MKVAVVGTGMVGVSIASQLVRLGHEVTMGSRSTKNEKGLAWVKGVGSPRASLATFAEATQGAELVFNCTLGVSSLEALKAAGTSNLAGKILLDLSNPLDFSHGMPPRLAVCNDDSMGEQIQRAFPETRVVKTLNTMSHTVMTNPKKLPGPHVVFVAGNDQDAKMFVRQTVLKEWFGWESVLDLGGIEASRGTEMYLPLWLKMWGVLGSGEFNIALVHEG